MTLVRPLSKQRVASNKDWWAEKGKEYPFHAEAPTSVRPELVDEALGVNIASVPLRTGWRTFGFKTAEDREKFMKQFGGVARKLADA